MFNFTNHRQPNSRHNLTFLIYRWLHPKDPPAEKNWWVTESTF
jgi:hypothetical protein